MLTYLFLTMFLRAPDDGGGAGAGKATAAPPSGGDGGQNAAAAAPAGDGSGDEGGDEALRAEGKQALDAMKARARDAEKQLKALRDEHEQLKQQSMTDNEKAVANARTEAENAAVSKLQRRIVEAEVRAAAGTKLADPMDAVRLLDVETLVDGDGDIDPEKVAKAIDNLIKKKPYLAAGPQPGGSFDGGARQSARAGGSMNDAIRAAAGRA